MVSMLPNEMNVEANKAIPTYVKLELQERDESLDQLISIHMRVALFLEFCSEPNRKSLEQQK